MRLCVVGENSLSKVIPNLKKKQGNFESKKCTEITLGPFGIICSTPSGFFFDVSAFQKYVFFIIIYYFYVSISPLFYFWHNNLLPSYPCSL